MQCSLTQVQSNSLTYIRKEEVYIQPLPPKFLKNKRNAKQLQMRLVKSQLVLSFKNARVRAGASGEQTRVEFALGLGLDGRRKRSLN